MDDEVLGGLVGFELGQGAAYGELDALCQGGAYLDAVYALHVVLDVGGELVACYADALVGDDAAQGDDGNLGGAAAYVDNHVAFGCLDVEAYAECGRHGLVNHVDVASAGVLGAVAHGAELDFGGAGGDAYDHAQRGGEPAALAADHLNQAANHVLGGVEVGDDAVDHGAHGTDARTLLAFHEVGGGAYCDWFA